MWHHLLTQGTLNDLEMALNNRKNKLPLIQHSDRGLQYCCIDYTKILFINGIGIRITENGAPYENAVAERINGILKTEFDLYKAFKNYDSAKECVHRAVKICNEHRPHMSCDYLTPNQAYVITGKKLINEKKMSLLKQHSVGFLRHFIECVKIKKEHLPP